MFVEDYMKTLDLKMSCKGASTAQPLEITINRDHSVLNQLGRS